MQEVSRRVEGARRGARAASRPSSSRRSASLPNPPDPSAADEDTTLREVGDATRHRRRPPRAGGPADRHGGRRARRGLALRLPQGRPRAARARARALGARAAAASTASSRSSRPCSCARRRCSAPASCPTPSSRSTGSPTTRSTSPGTSEVALASLHAGEMLAEADLPLRYAGFSPVLPPRGGRGRAATRAASSACTSSTRSRCSASCARRTPRPSTSGCSTIEEAILQALEIPYRVVNIAVDDLGASAAKKYDMRGVAARPAALPRADLDLEHDRLPGAPARHPLPAGGRRQAARTSTRSTAPRSRSAGR